MSKRSASESTRLEELWSGDFGDEYIERNKDAGAHRARFWDETLSKYPSPRVLEVGCNVGSNLQWIASHISPENVYGVDINQKAIDLLRENVPGANALLSPARELPFRDGWFDLVFTMGVLIHQPESTLQIVMNEMVRCSRKYILCGEYHAASTEEVPYRDQHGALFKRNYGALFLEWFPALKLLEHGHLDRDDGWDDVTFWVFRKGP